MSGDYSFPPPQTIQPSFLPVPTGYILVPLHWAKCINKQTQIQKILKFSWQGGGVLTVPHKSKHHSI